MNKKLYILPNTTVVTISTNDMLVVSCCGQSRKKDFGSETICPFNGLWCVEKQNRLDEWRHAVQHVASKGENYVFFTRGDMFDGCPRYYTTLCSQHEQKQRG